MKKIISLALAVMMIATMSVTAFAADNTLDNERKTGTTEVTHAVSDSYIVTIPDSMTVGTPATVSVSDVTLAKDYKLAVSVSSAQYNDGWKLKNGDDTIGYTLKIDNQDIANNGEVLTAKSGETATKTLKTELVDKATYSGTYKDTLTFSVSVSESNTTTENTPKITGVSISGDMVSTDTENKTYTITVPADGTPVWITQTVTGTNLKKILDNKLESYYILRQALDTENVTFADHVDESCQYNDVDKTIYIPEAGYTVENVGRYKLVYSNDNYCTFEDTGWTIIVVEDSATEE